MEETFLVLNILYGKNYRDLMEAKCTYNFNYIAVSCTDVDIYKRRFRDMDEKIEQDGNSPAEKYPILL